MSNETQPPEGKSLLLVLSAPSGTGKTTLAHRLGAETPGCVFSISCTTRKPRGQEQEGVDYYFLSEAKFREFIHQDKLAEWAEVFGHFYGTLRTTIDEATRKSNIVLFDIDVHGGEQIKAKYPNAVTVFVRPPSFDELARRLRSRGTDRDDVIERRLLAAESEILRGRSYDYTIVNDRLETALDDLKAIVRAERLRSRRFDFGVLGF